METQCMIDHNENAKSINSDKESYTQLDNKLATALASSDTPVNPFNMKTNPNLHPNSNAIF